MIVATGHNGWTDQFEDQEEPRPGFHNDRVSEFSMPLDWSQLAEWLPIGRWWFMEDLLWVHDWDKMFWWPFMTETKCSYQPSERWAVCDAISLSCVTKCSSFRWLETTFCSKCQSWKVTKAHKPSPPYIYRFSFTWGPAKLPDQKPSKEAKDNILKLWYPLLINITKNRHENDIFVSWPIK